MKIEKIHLDDITRCYCASHMKIDDKFYAFLGSENPESPCYSYTGDNFEVRETVWDDRGGCMSIIPFPTRKGEFLAVNEFYLKVTPSKAKIVWGKKLEDGWAIRDLFALPYVHRFDIYHVHGMDYLILATIAKNKQNKEDWSLPGQIYVTQLPENLEDEIHLELLVDGLFRNHGYCRGTYEGLPCGYFGSDQGLIRVSPSSNEVGKWNIEKILDGQIGEVALSDINHDGVEELMTIEPFHGNCIKVYKLVNGKYVEDYVYPNTIDFAHTLVGKSIRGVNSFIAGVRRVDAELFILQYMNGEYVLTYVDKGKGPANIDVVNFQDYDLIISANHTANEAAIYKVSD
ncbi:hypothetical protein [Bulleidia sp. zg-1006]|uniref:hypothetical protein n=1 Tax=Bulleidia sp. zg-1006 TaxID=2806552 RepID=UPI0019399156|nr:hypothetical protein [Bulleidia sp. zg-1006]QRG87435.1 hypothetical protein JOS54_03760 [Bulleidia sp. zg-1006]